MLAELRERRRALARDAARGSRPRRSRRTAAYEAAIAAWFARRRGASRASRPVVREAARPRLRREPAPAGRVLRRARRAHAPALAGRAAARPRALVQQPQRPRTRAPARARVRAAGVRDRQAREPVRRRRRRDDRGGVRARARRRSALRVRRRRRAQPAGRRPRSASGSRSSSSRCCSRRATTRRRSTALRAKPATRILDDRERRARRRRRARLQARARRAARAGARLGRRRPRGRWRSSPASRREAQWGDLLVRLARLQARHLERDRAREGPADDRDRRRPDEPRRRGPDRDREGARARALARGRRARLRRVLPVRGRAAAGARRGRDRADPAGRLEAGRRGDRGGREAPARRWSSPAAATSGTDRRSSVADVRSAAEPREERGDASRRERVASEPRGQDDCRASRIVRSPSHRPPDADTRLVDELDLRIRSTSTPPSSRRARPARPTAAALG